MTQCTYEVHLLSGQNSADLGTVKMLLGDALNYTLGLDFIELGFGNSPNTWFRIPIHNIAYVRIMRQERQNDAL